MTVPNLKKRIIVCCDGTWQNADNGYVKGKSSNQLPSLQIPSNVTRISRCFKRLCSDGTLQVIYYLSGVGSRSNTFDKIFRGAFGVGISENIREAYAYICANYFDGDEIILIGFSRGAYTARAIGGMISDIGLLTREGMEYFYPIFKDMQNFGNNKYHDEFPELPFPNKPRGNNADAVGRYYLEELVELKFYNTNLSSKIEHGFHALALDEIRGPFQPTLWERQAADEAATSDLRQVWFPGSHGNVGGGWEDQGIANITLAWMMDQLASVGCEFVRDSLEKIHHKNVQHYLTRHNKGNKKKCGKEKEGGHAVCCGCGVPRRKSTPWAAKPIYEANKPVRPWSLQVIRLVKSPLYNLTGQATRTPGMYRKYNPDTGEPTTVFLEDTNERVHRSVRARLACEGLGPEDKGAWLCRSLLLNWVPRRVEVQNLLHDPVPECISSEQENPIAAATEEVSGEASRIIASENQETENNGHQRRWVWEYIGPHWDGPAVRTMMEETIGPYERELIWLNRSKLRADEYAEENHDHKNWKAFNQPRIKSDLKKGKHQAAKAKKRREREIRKRRRKTA